MTQNIFELLDQEQKIECERLASLYDIVTAYRYARVVTSEDYKHRKPWSSPRCGKAKYRNVDLELGDIVSTETYAETVSDDGWHNVSGVRFVTGAIVKIKGDSVWINCDGEIICTLADQCWRTK